MRPAWILVWKSSLQIPNVPCGSQFAGPQTSGDARGPIIVCEAMNTKAILLVQLYGELQPSNIEPLAIEVLASALMRECPDCRVDMTIVNPRKKDKTIVL